MYTLLKLAGQSIIKRDDGTFIPIDEGNRFYQEFLDWIAEGNTANIEEEVKPAE